MARNFRIIVFVSFLVFVNCQDEDRGLVVSLLPDHISEIVTFPGKVDSFVSPKETTDDKNGNKFLYFFGRTDVLSMACDPWNHSIYVLDGLTQSLYKMNNFNIWMNDTRRNVILMHQGVSHSASSQIAFDWLSRNIYWTDDHYNWIGVQPVDTTDKTMYKIIMHDGLWSPLSLAVDPIKGYLFVAEHGANTVIDRTDLAGEDRKTIITSVSKVPDMVLDIEEERIYWIDIGRNSLETAKYDGTDRRMVRRSTNIYILMSGLTLYKDVVCLTKFQEGEVLCLDKRSGAVVWSNSFPTQQPWSVEVYDKELQKKVPHACESKGCDHICTNTPSGAKCLCKEGFELHTDGRTCKASHKLYGKGLLIANGTDMCMLDIRVITAHENDVRCFLSWKSNITYVAVDANKNKIYFSDNANRQIQKYDVVLNVTSVIATTSIAISGLAYDWINDDIYWSEKDTGKIKVTTAANNVRQEATIFWGLDRPSFLTINTHNSTLYWIANRNGQYSIEGGSFDGMQRWKIAEKAILLSPSGLFYDITYKKLFFTDKGELKSIDPDGKDLHALNSVGSDDKVLVYKDYALVYNGGTSIRNLNIHTKNFQPAINLTDFKAVSYVAAFDKSIQKTERSPCMVNNGGCEHICLLDKGQKKCRCGFGFTLRSDGLNCSSTPMLEEFAMTVDYTHGILYQISLQNADVKAIDIPAPNYPMCATYDTRRHKIYWTDFQRYQILQSTIWGQNKSVVFNTGSYIPGSIQVDSSTGNIYYAATTFDFMKGVTSHIAVVRPKSGQNKVVISQLEVVKTIALHPQKGWLYWIDKGGAQYTSYIGRGAMDGDSRSFFVSSNLYSPTGLTVDYKDEKLYWSDSYMNTVNYIGLDGNNRGELTHDPRADIMHIAIYGSHLYYTAVNRQFITKVNKKTGTISSWMSETPEFGRLETLSLYPGDLMPVNEKCAVNNGLCSTFCLPTPFGRTCACEEGVLLEEDGRTCKGVKKCNQTIPNGGFNMECTGYLGSTCRYHCFQGYLPARADSELHCNYNGDWGVQVDQLCQPYDPSKAAEYSMKTNTLNNAALGGILGGVIVVLVIIFVIVIIILYKRRSGMFAHAKFVNAPNVQLNPSNAEKIDKDIGKSKEHSNGTLNGTLGTSNPVYEYKADKNDSNHHVYSTLDV
ncbi:low-density lipoprotein receptor-related protein 4-like [Saccostrea cucullata]|uniref:low-density lipoprotein receptor-related protein 4-like n=1 Tax=Saccostrea cuccullata TaxID=36930 RepID=UPI002ED089C9